MVIVTHLIVTVTTLARTSATLRVQPPQLGKSQNGHFLKLSKHTDKLIIPHYSSKRPWGENDGDSRGISLISLSVILTELLIFKVDLVFSFSKFTVFRYWFPHQKLPKMKKNWDGERLNLNMNFKMRLTRDFYLNFCTSYEQKKNEQGKWHFFPVNYFFFALFLSLSTLNFTLKIWKNQQLCIIRLNVEWNQSEIYNSTRSSANSRRKKKRSKKSIFVIGRFLA